MLLKRDMSNGNHLAPNVATNVPVDKLCGVLLFRLIYLRLIIMIIIYFEGDTLKYRTSSEITQPHCTVNKHAYVCVGVRSLYLARGWIRDDMRALDCQGKQRTYGRRVG